MKKNFYRVSGEIILAEFNHECMLSPFERIVKNVDNVSYPSNPPSSPPDEKKIDNLSIEWWKLAKNGDKYTGEFKKNMFYGEGKFIKSNGEVKEGFFKNNKFIN